MRLARQTVEQVRNISDIVSVIQDYVALKKRGKNYIGLCPFHSEKTPSFTVSPEKKIWHCFGCHESGDLIAFVTKLEQLSFPEAVVFLANRMGIDVEEDQTAQSHEMHDNREKIRQILLLVREKMKILLMENGAVKEYLTKRGVNEKSMADFHLGYAPLSFDWLRFLEGSGFTQEEILRSGMVYRHEQAGYIARFRDRVIFPVMDSLDRPVGFGGRVMKELKVAKYLNSEDSDLFSKRRLLYGLSKARSAIKKRGYALLMEGYMDVILSHQHGFSHAVAVMGTALTKEHVQQLNRFTNKVILALDGDEAGQVSTEKSYEVLKHFGFDVSVISFQKEDPADVLERYGKQAFENKIKEAIPIVEFQFYRALKRYDKTKIEQVSPILDVVVPLLRQEDDLIVRNYYIQKFSKELAIDDDLVIAKIKKSGYNVSRKLKLSVQNRKNRVVRAEEFILYFVATNLESRQRVRKNIEKIGFVTETHRRLLALICDEECVNHHLIEKVEDIKSKSLLSRIILDMESKGLDEAEETTLDECLSVLQESKKQERIKEIREAIKMCEASSSGRELTDLMHELQQLIKG